MIELRDLLRMLIDYRWLIGGVFSACLLASVVLLLTVTPVYRANVYLQPPDQQQVIVRDDRGIALSDVRWQHSLAGIADPELGGSDADAGSSDYRFPYEDSTAAIVFHRFLENLRSRQFRSEYFLSAGVMDIYASAGYLAGSGWSPERVFEEVFDPNLLVYWGGEAFEEKFAHISFDFEDPRAAAQVLNGFIAMIERRTVEMIIEGAERQLVSEIRMIEAQLAASDRDLPPLRARLKMLSRIKLSKESIAVVRIDQPAVESPKPRFPRPDTTLALASLAGLILGLASALAMGSIRRSAASVAVH